MARWAYSWQAVSPGIEYHDFTGEPESGCIWRPNKTKLTMQSGGNSTVLEEATLGGGQISGLLRFQNTDLVDARNLLGRMALAIGTAANDQHKLGST